MRINKYLAFKGYATRRGADELIEKKKVFVNGVLAVLGDKIKETDVVEVRQKVKTSTEYHYAAYHKPINLVTHAGVETEPDITRTLPKELQSLKLFPVGRLDKNSHGLIILTNDGRITDRLLNPKYEHEKEYEVTVAKNLRTSFKNKMEAGVNIEGYVTKPTKVKIVNDRQFIVTLTEGKTHQIRRMVAALFNQVMDLKRIRVMNIKLGDLAPGTTRTVEGEELADFFRELGL